MPIDLWSRPLSPASTPQSSQVSPASTPSSASVCESVSLASTHCSLSEAPCSLESIGYGLDGLDGLDGLVLIFKLL
jgi:hypothetical protein